MGARRANARTDNPGDVDDNDDGDSGDPTTARDGGAMTTMKKTTTAATTTKTITTAAASMMTTAAVGMKAMAGRAMTETSCSYTLSIILFSQRNK